MEKVTKKDLNERLLMVETLLGLHRERPEQISIDKANDAIFRMQWAVSRGKELAERESKPKQLDQSVFDGLDEKWRFAAVDDDGRAYYFMKKPVIDQDDPCFIDGSTTRCKWIGEGYDASNWQNSLIERDIAKELLEVDLSSELTGSGLARAMLERGDRWILCGNTTDGFASPCVIDGYRCNEDDLGFVLTNGKSIEPQYIHPVNNQGEPLTAAEAGL